MVSSLMCNASRLGAVFVHCWHIHSAKPAKCSGTCTISFPHLLQRIALAPFYCLAIPVCPGKAARCSVDFLQPDLPV